MKPAPERALELLAPPRTTEDLAEFARLAEATLNDRDAAFMKAIVTPDFTFATRAEWVEGPQEYEGMDGVAEWWRGLDEIFEDLRYSDTEVVADAGDTLVVSQRSTTRLAGSDASVTADVYLVLRLRDGRLARQETFTDRDEALGAAGVK